MLKRKWLWRKKSKSPGDTESSGSMSPHSEICCEDQEICKASPNHETESPEVSSNALAGTEDLDDKFSNQDASDTLRILTERLSTALMNVRAKEDLVKQHEKVAEEALSGWEKAENELGIIRFQLGAAVQQKTVLENQVSHLDGALKECVKQLRQVRDEQEQRILEALNEKTRDWDFTRSNLEQQLLELQMKSKTCQSESLPQTDLVLINKLESLKDENSSLKQVLLSQSEELEIRTIERDLSTQAAETASKQYLESIKKIAKLEAECRRLKAASCKSFLVNNHKSTSASSIYVESFTDSQSDSGERINSVDIDIYKMTSSESNKCEASCSDSWASALITELDQFKISKSSGRNLPATSIEIDLMDDFLEMEKLAALPESLESAIVPTQSTNGESTMRAELEAMISQITEMDEKLKKMEGEKVQVKEKLEKMEIERAQFEEKLEKIEVEKAEQETFLRKREDCFHEAEVKLKEKETKLEELERELIIANSRKQNIESQLVSMEVEARTMSAKVGSLEAEVRKESALSSEYALKCQKLNEESLKCKREEELSKNTSPNSEVTMKQEDLTLVSGRLAECQRTISSLGNQLKSLATLEDFLIDSPNLPGFSAGKLLITRPGKEEQSKSHDNWTYSPKRDLDSSRIGEERSESSITKNEDNSSLSSSSSTSSSIVSSHVSSEKNRNGFVKFFSRTKNGTKLEI